MTSQRQAMARIGALGVGMLLAALTGCGDSATTAPLTPKAPDTLTALPRSLSSAERQAVSNANTFGFGLLREVLGSASASENVVLSPFSASVALGMTMNGAAGATEAGMRTTLGWDAAAPAADINGAYRDLGRLLGSLDASVTLTSANAIWYRQGFAVEPAFLQAARDFFSATVQAADFTSPATVTAVNDWASRATNGKITNVLDRITQDHMMFLLNALYFKGTWRTQFETSQTRAREFQRADGRTASIPFMHRSMGGGRMFFGPDFRVLELPYGNGAYVMDFFVPTGSLSLRDLAGRLAGQGLSQALLNLRDQPEATLAVPRFTITGKRALKDPLSALGMGTAFDCARADFTRLTTATNVCIGAVQQDAMIEVNEQGTEAAAVTRVDIIRVSLPPEFAVDRPFLFAIRERFSNTTYFLGAVQSLGN
ncbi:MAG: serpin family protein [Gemmatimonadaceae bacterium]|jgi:serpin B|nr:serpin family protein [Gemmatimonadaceae bacterium]